MPLKLGRRVERASGRSLCWIVDPGEDLWTICIYVLCTEYGVHMMVMAIVDQYWKTHGRVNILRTVIIGGG